MIKYEDILFKLNAETRNLRELIWGEDIPSATILEYKKLHEVFTKFMKYIDNNLLNLFCEFCKYYNNDCEEKLKDKRCFNNSWFIVSSEYNNIYKFLEEYKKNINELRQMIIDNDVIPGDNPELREYHSGCVSFMNYITGDIMPILEELIQLK